MTIQLDLFDRKPTLTAERVRELFDYNPETGQLIRKKWRGGSGRAGSIAGTPSPDGNLRLAVDRGTYLAHRIVWLHYYGAFPDDVIDHINGKPWDNRISNLRAATQAQNMRNRMNLSSANKSGVTGVRQRKNGSWRAFITLNEKLTWLGTFTDKADAIAARRAAERHYFAEFAPNHGTDER